MMSITAFDTTTERLLSIHRSTTGVDFFSLLTWLGDTRVLAVIAISLSVILVRDRHWDYARGLLVSLAGTTLGVAILKYMVARDRPPFEVPMSDAPGYSFPSLHAAGALAVYGFLAFMIARLMHPPRHRLPSVIALSILIVAIGLSRMYLGVHYPSDVVGGYLVGGLFLAIGIRATHEKYRFVRRPAKPRPVR